MPEINYIAILVCAIVSMIIGGIWYGPLFSKMWMEGMGWNPNDQALMAKMKKAAGPAYAQQFIGSLLIFFGLAMSMWAFTTADPTLVGVSAGLQGGFWTWLTFMVPVKYGDKLWGGKSFKFVSIDLGYYLVTLLIGGVILALWR
ncbi:MAG TPA: DUF1761 domain-containing protein [Patescibacteria group bacterium]|nr:DUF1761 domain-containing protein [Patescibacteria group bacterium]